MDKLPPHFRNKWSSLSLVVDPTNQTLAKIVGEASSLSDNPDQGQTFWFANGALVSYGSITEPFLVYGDIYEHWKSMAGLNSGYGHPIADPQFLPDGSICSIFQGGHVHRRPGGREVKPEPFPPNQCPAPHKPPIPAPLANGLRNWPNVFRERWSWLSIQRDPYGKQLVDLIGPADTWPETWPGLTENDNGGKTLHFSTGKLISYDFRTPPFLIYGKIHSLWSELNGVKSGLGHPLADPQILEDGSICSIFEGGHVHQVGTRDAEFFPASQCTAQYQPTVPPGLANATPYWPQHFRQKWTSLSLERDPSEKQLTSLLGPTDCWPSNWPGLTENPNGGKTLHFRYGRLISNTFQSPPFLVYGKIFSLWDDLSCLNSGFGYPLADPQILQDGTVCSVFEGGHIHMFGSKDAEIVPASECSATNNPVASGASSNTNQYWPVLFRSKWASLAWKRDASGKQLGVLLGPADCWPSSWPGLTDNDDGGKTLHFRNGGLISYDNQTPPCLVYGNIYEVWKKLGGTKSQLKYPLADPQFLPDESVCSVFEGGHIHQPRGSQDADMFPPNQCTAPYKPTDRTSQMAGPTIQPSPPVVPVYQPPAPSLAPIQTWDFQPPVQNFQPPIPAYSTTTPDYSSPSQSAYPYYPPTADGQQPPQDSQSPDQDSQTHSQYIAIHSQVTQTHIQPVHPPPQPQAQPGAHHGHGKRKMVSAGIRMLGAGINRVADVIDKHSQGK